MWEFDFHLVAIYNVEICGKIAVFQYLGYNILNFFQKGQNILTPITQMKKNITTAIRKYCTRFQIKNKYSRPSEATLRRIIKKIENEFNIGTYERIGRGDAVNDIDTDSVKCAMNIFKDQNILPTTRNIGKEVSRTTVYKIMKKQLKMKLYKLQTCQTLTEQHTRNRFAFSEKFLLSIGKNSSFLDNDIYFSLSGLVNKQNTRF